MTSPYSVLPATTPIHERRPSYEDLKRRAEEAGFSGGRGVMDTREWYELCYYYPIEEYLFESLRAQYSYDPKMTFETAAVCVSTWIYDNSVSRATYEHIKDRLLFVDDNLRDYDDEQAGSREKIMQTAFKGGYVFAYRIYRYGDEIENNGQGSGPYLAPRDDIDNYLDELVWRECAENDAEIIATHGREAFEDLTKILEESQERDNQRYLAADKKKSCSHLTPPPSGDTGV